MLVDILAVIFDLPKAPLEGDRDMPAETQLMLLMPIALTAHSPYVD